MSRAQRVSVTTLALLMTLSGSLGAQSSGLQDFDPLGPGNLTVSLKILALLTVLTVAPAILLLTTAFTRIIIVLGFVRRALSLQEVPPNQIILGLGLILTYFVMSPTIEKIQAESLEPYLDLEISDAEAVQRATAHMRAFMWSQVDKDALDVMISLSVPGEEIDSEEGLTLAQVPLATLTSAFVLSELKRAFQMGFMIYLPFVVIDLIVASTLISMGMLVLPPVLISLPFKVLVFVLVDGWEIVVVQLARSF